MSNYNEVIPCYKDLLAIHKLPYIEGKMICVEWVNWAITYTGSELNKLHTGFKPTLYEFYDYLACLKKAVSLYIQENGIE